MHDCCRLGRSSTITRHILHFGQHLSIGHGLFSTWCTSLLFGTNQLCCPILSNIQHLRIWCPTILWLLISDFTLKITPTEPGHFQRSFISFQKLTKQQKKTKLIHSIITSKKITILPFFSKFHSLIKQQQQNNMNDLSSATTTTLCFESNCAE